MSQSQNDTQPRQAGRLIGIGFGMVIVLILALAVITLMRLDRIHENLRKISEDYTLDAQLAHQMYDASRERGFLLFSIVNEEDPFLADERVMHFRELSAVFGEARQALLKQPLLPEEKLLLEKQGHAAADTMMQQDMVLGLVFADNREMAQKTLARYALPSQEGVLSAVDLLIKIQNKKVEKASKQAAKDERMVYQFLLMGSAITVLLSGLIAFYVRRRVFGLMS